MALGKKTGGRERGTPNRATAAVKAKYLEVFAKLQEDETKSYALLTWAQNNPGDWYKLTQKFLPQALEVAGEDGGPLEIVIKKVVRGTSE